MPQERTGGLQCDDLELSLGLAELRWLDCSRAEVSDLSPLARLTALQSLDSGTAPSALFVRTNLRGVCAGLGRRYRAAAADLPASGADVCNHPLQYAGNHVVISTPTKARSLLLRPNARARQRRIKKRPRLTGDCRHRTSTGIGRAGRSRMTLRPSWRWSRIRFIRGERVRGPASRRAPDASGLARPLSAV
jgi:hypothetical protein